jgi:acyl dehydratase
MGYVTDEHRALIEKRGPRQVAAAPVSEDGLRRFVQAVMETNPVHWASEVAQQEGFESVVATPLYPTHASRRPSGSPDPLDRLREDPEWDGAGGGSIGGLPALEFPLDRILNGGTEAEFFKLASVGDVISAQSRYVRIEDREGRSGPMVVATIETEYRDQHEALLVRVRNTLIRR